MIDNILKIAQIIFYGSGIVVAIKTYLKAKAGILNSVNTEYQKRVMDRLISLSDELFSELDPSSPYYWLKEDPAKEVVGKINKRFETNRDIILKSGVFPPGIPMPSMHDRLNSILNKVKSDPLIPKSIRVVVVDFLEKRWNKMLEIYMQVLKTYCSDLAKGKHLKDLNGNCDWLHNKIIDKLYEEGIGVSQIEDKIHEIRLHIQEYFESFNPFKEKIEIKPKIRKLSKNIL